MGGSGGGGGVERERERESETEHSGTDRRLRGLAADHDDTATSGGAVAVKNPTAFHGALETITAELPPSLKALRCVVVVM